MDTINNTKYRFYDGAGEPCRMLAPIAGFNKKPLVSLEQATEPLNLFIPDIQIKVNEAKTRAVNHTDDLSIDESAAIILYTMEWHPYTNSLYYILNATLRTEDRQHLRPWFLYLKLLLTALSRLPTISLRVYRGIALSDHDKYQQGNTLVWWGFSSCSINRNISEDKTFFGQNNGQTLFIIDCLKGKDIGKHSYFKKENEILLSPATTLQVIQCNYQINNLYVIHLKEIQSPHQLLESVSTDAEIETLKTSSGLNNIESSVKTIKQYFNPKLNAEIARFKDRSHACLFRKRFTDDDLEIVVQEVIINKQCRVLMLSGNEVSSQGVILVVKSLENNHTLEELYLTDIQMCDISVQTLAQTLSNGTNLSLKRLCLNHNGITDEAAEYLAMMLETNQTLTHLWLPKNLISDRGIQSFAKVLVNNKTLQMLSLARNIFENDLTVNSLIEMIEKNQTLIQLEIDGRDLSRSDIKKLKTMAKTKRNFKLTMH